jgi:hypothetical protein
MAHIYVIQSVTHVADVGTVSGTVDGVPVVANFWFSALTAQASVLLGQQNVLAPAMLAALPVVPVNLPTYPGTITV